MMFFCLGIQVINFIIFWFKFFLMFHTNISIAQFNLNVYKKFCLKTNRRTIRVLANTITVCASILLALEWNNRKGLYMCNEGD